MISLVLMAAMSTAPEMNANLFKRHRAAAPAACSTCDAPAAPCGGCDAGQAAGGMAPGGIAPGGNVVAPPNVMPKGDMPPKDMPKVQPPVKVDAPKGDKVELIPAPAKKAEAPIEIPADLKAAIEKSDQKAQIMEYLNNQAVPREARIQYLENDVRRTLLPNEKK